MTLYQSKTHGNSAADARDAWRSPCPLPAADAELDP
jgi:hypothetical protein